MGKTSLRTKARPSATPPKEEEIQERRKRGRYNGEGKERKEGGRQCQEEEKVPRTKMNLRQDPPHKEATTSTGANTPVRVKIKKGGRENVIRETENTAHNQVLYGPEKWACGSLWEIWWTQNIKRHRELDIRWVGPMYWV